MRRIIALVLWIGFIFFLPLGIVGLIGAFQGDVMISLFISAFSFGIAYGLFKLIQINKKHIHTNKKVKTPIKAMVTEKQAPVLDDAAPKDNRLSNKIAEQLTSGTFIGCEEAEAEIAAEDAFPEYDSNGLKRLKILTNVKLTGVTRSFEGTNPQDILESIQYDSDTEIKLARKEVKGYPYAVAVMTLDNEPLGWVPESLPYLEDIAQRLDEGATTLANIESIYGGENGKNFGITINIARYKNRRRTIEAAQEAVD